MMQSEPMKPPTAVYRPEPEAPSPRWARAAWWLMLAVRTTWATLAVDLVSSALVTWARVRMQSGQVREVTPLLMAANTMYMLTRLATSAVWIGACVSLVALPAWVGARRAAKGALALAVIQLVEPFVGTMLTMAMARAQASSMHFAVRGLLFGGVEALLHAAYVLLVAHAIERATETLDRGRPVRLVPWALFAVALSFGSIASNFLTTLVGLAGAWVYAVSFVLSGALATTRVWGWTRGLRTASAVFGAQSWPESHRGGPDAGP
jgi:hypothetical protein